MGLALVCDMGRGLMKKARIGRDKTHCVRGRFSAEYVLISSEDKAQNEKTKFRCTHWKKEVTTCAVKLFSCLQFKAVSRADDFKYLVCSKSQPHGLKVHESYNCVGRRWGGALRPGGALTKPTRYDDIERL